MKFRDNAATETRIAWIQIVSILFASSKLHDQK
jgi:hypothetical protein